MHVHLIPTYLPTDLPTYMCMCTYIYLHTHSDIHTHIHVHANSKADTGRQGDRQTSCYDSIHGTSTDSSHAATVTNSGMLNEAST